MAKFKPGENAGAGSPRVPRVLGTVAQFLTHHRIKQDLSQRAVARKAEVAVRSIQLWETGQVNYTFANVVKWAGALGLEIKFVKKSVPAQRQME